MANLPMVRKLQTATFAAAFFGSMALAMPMLAVHAATYGSDNYGGGPFNTGVDPAPSVQVSSGGGVVIGGPLGIGYVVTNASTTITVSSPILATSTAATTSIPTSSATVSTPAAGVANFSKPLQYRDRNPDVRALQVYLNEHGFAVAQTGDGSSGSETDFFGILTFKALTAFQTAHALEILVPLGLTVGTGYFGPATMNFFNQHP